MIFKNHTICHNQIEIMSVKNFLNFSEEENFVERVQTTVQGNIFFLMFMSDIFSQSFSGEFDCTCFLLQ